MFVLTLLLASHPTQVTLVCLSQCNINDDIVRGNDIDQIDVENITESDEATSFEKRANEDVAINTSGGLRLYCKTLALL
jgi:hypothetical protein